MILFPILNDKFSAENIKKCISFVDGTQILNRDCYIKLFMDSISICEVKEKISIELIIGWILIIPKLRKCFIGYKYKKEYKKFLNILQIKLKEIRLKGKTIEVQIQVVKIVLDQLIGKYLDIKESYHKEYNRKFFF